MIFGAGDILSPGSKLSISFLTVTVNHKYLQKNMFMILLIEQTGTEESMETAVSVIIPVYNCEKTVGRCINSVLNQIGRASCRERV